MAKIEAIKSPVALAIERHYEASETPRDSARIGASSIGKECDRAIWYDFRWVSPHEKIEGRKLRLFQTGHREEVRMLDDLRAIGCAVASLDPSTRQQWEATFVNGVVVSKLDAKAKGIPGAAKALHIVECKTMSDKNFIKWRKEGLEKFSSTYWAQVQIGMAAHGIDRTLFMAMNKNTDEVETERVKPDLQAVICLTVKAERIAWSDRPPAKIESYACKWCKHERVCRYDDFPRVNCRTCLHVTLTGEGRWRCGSTGAELTLEQQRAGCPAHLFLPDIVPGEQIDADEDAATVTYRLVVGGRLWTDGVDSKEGLRP